MITEVMTYTLGPIKVKMLKSEPDDTFYVLWKGRECKVLECIGLDQALFVFDQCVEKLGEAEA